MSVFDDKGNKLEFETGHVVKFDENKPNQIFKQKNQPLNHNSKYIIIKFEDKAEFKVPLA